MPKTHTKAGAARDRGIIGTCDAEWRPFVGDLSKGYVLNFLLPIADWRAPGSLHLFNTTPRLARPAAIKPAAIAVATRFRSWTLTGQTTSHATQYPSMVLPLFSNLSSARRVYASCSCCWPHAGQVEKKETALVMGRSVPQAAIRDASSLTHSWDSSPCVLLSRSLPLSYIPRARPFTLLRPIPAD